jgi:hypothetical protein
MVSLDNQLYVNGTQGLAKVWRLLNMHISDMNFDRLGRQPGILTTKCGTISFRSRQVETLPYLIAPFVCH